MCGIYMSAGERNTGGLYKGIYEDKRQLYAVCDGMGGLDQGERASLLTVSGMNRLVPLGLRKIPDGLQALVNEISAALQSPYGGAGFAGSTLAAVYIDGTRAITANLGDSRVYFKRGTFPLSQVTEDHSQAMWYLKHGILAPEEAETHQSRNILRRHIGAPDEEGKTPQLSKAIRVKPGDAFLLCSDGLSNMMTLQEMDAEISKDQNCSDTCRNLVTLALKRDADDNVTALLIRIRS